MSLSTVSKAQALLPILQRPTNTAYSVLDISNSARKKAAQTHDYQQNPYCFWIRFKDSCDYVQQWRNSMVASRNLSQPCRTKRFAVDTRLAVGCKSGHWWHVRQVQEIYSSSRMLKLKPSNTSLELAHGVTNSRLLKLDVGNGVFKILSRLKSNLPWRSCFPLLQQTHWSPTRHVNVACNALADTRQLGRL